MAEREEALHDAINALAVAGAVLEGMIDGVLERSEERLRGVLHAVQTAANALSRAEQE